MGSTYLGFSHAYKYRTRVRMTVTNTLGYYCTSKKGLMIQALVKFRKSFHDDREIRIIELVCLEKIQLWRICVKNILSGNNIHIGHHCKTS
jgi:hypothetical protein